MCVDDCLDGPVFAAVSLVEGPCSGASLLRRERVDDNHALVAFDEGGVGQVKPTHLVDAVGDMIEPIQVSEP